MAEKEEGMKPLISEGEKEEKLEGEKERELAEKEVKKEVAEEQAEKKLEEEKVEAEEKKEEETPKIWPRKRRSRGSRAISGVTKEDFMEFARKYYPSLVEEFEAARIPFEELKTRVERDVGLVWVDLKE